MSKTFGASSIRAEARAYWRRFAESATGWWNKYRLDPFFNTEVNVIVLQALFALVVLCSVAVAYTALREDVTGAIVSVTERADSLSLRALEELLIGEINAIRTWNMLLLGGFISAITIFFGFVIARITLRPARNALAAQKQFIGNVAHELRTPLSVIKTNTEVALLDEHVHPDMREILNSNVEELDRISEIINNLLSLSALVRPERIEFSAVDLANVASDVVQKFSQLAKRGEQQVTLRRSPDCVVWGNTTALQQIVGNLLKNAISYTPRGGHIRVTVEPAPGGSVELLVQDSGIGIARKDLFRIFEPFYRADPSRTRTVGGTGLGLAIVSELVKMHQGRITIRSAIGRGTTVAVLLPGVASGRAVGEEVETRDTLSEIAVDFSKH